MDFKEFEAKVVARAWKDPKFKKKLLENPTATCEEFVFELTGKKIKVPKSYVVKVIEVPANTMVILLEEPPANKELSEEKMKHLAAGCPLKTFTSSLIC